MKTIDVLCLSQMLKQDMALQFNYDFSAANNASGVVVPRKPPQSDNAYFENLCRVIFQTGLNWRVGEKKWPTIKAAFCNFDVDRVAAFTQADIERLLSDKSVIRNVYKIHAIIAPSSFSKSAISTALSAPTWTVLISQTTTHVTLKPSQTALTV